LDELLIAQWLTGDRRSTQPLRPVLVRAPCRSQHLEPVAVPPDRTWKDPGPYSVHSEYSLRLQSLFGIIFPGYHVHTATFAGIVAFSLSVFAAGVLWRDPRVRFFALLGLGALFISLGSNSLLHGVLYAVVPMVEKARSPGVAAYLFNFAVAILAAFSVQEILSGRISRHTGQYSRILFIFSGITLVFGFVVTELR
jgi:hypothetical protein